MIGTFYSYKDGVGRTMALANIGALLREAGLRVLLVDFDLEGPSLDRYFSRQDPKSEQLGFMDLVAAYKQALLDPGLPARAQTSRTVLDDLETFLSAVPRSPSSTGQLFVMSTGRVDAQYPARIQEFDWRDFYARWEGELFFRWLRRQFAERFDVTLVDVRAGFTATGLIGCYQVADVVICFCGPRQREALGLSKMIEGFLRPEVVEKRQAPLRVLVVPSRIGDAEANLLDQIHELFRSTFAAVAPPGLSIDDLWRAKVPNIPYFANQDAVVVDPHSAAGQRLRDAYRRVAALMCLIAPPESRLAGAYDAMRAS